MWISIKQRAKNEVCLNFKYYFKVNSRCYMISCINIPIWIAKRLKPTLGWVAIPFSRGSSWPRDWTCISCIAGRFFIIWATREAQTVKLGPNNRILRRYFTIMEYTCHKNHIILWGKTVSFDTQISSLSCLHWYKKWLR